MNRLPSVSAGEPNGSRILIVTATRQAHHPFVRELTATPSVLGRHYVVVTMTAAEASVDADEPFTLIIIDDDQDLDMQLVDTLRAAAPQTPLLIVARLGIAQQPAAAMPYSYELTTTARLRSAVARILQPQPS